MLIKYRFSIKFQFHYGSVKSKSRLYVTSNNLLFQFHYGSVKRHLMQETC